jgi:hypothetical protein
MKWPHNDDNSGPPSLPLFQICHSASFTYPENLFTVHKVESFNDGLDHPLQMSATCDSLQSIY